MNLFFQGQDRHSLVKVLKSGKKSTFLLWTILVLFPIATILGFIWPANIFKEKIQKGWRVLLWILYIPIAVSLVLQKLLLIVCIIAVASNPNAGGESITRENVAPPDYRSTEEFYKLTGVQFPELELIDSLYYEDAVFITSRFWNEYKYVAIDGFNSDFYERLNEACRNDSTHWYYDESEQSYSYYIRPDIEPVDRSRGMCDRMVQMDDGQWVDDWDGSFISVDIQNDTIVLRDGWAR